MTTIVTKNGSGAPLASDLVQGELAVDLTNKRLYTEDSGGSVIELGSNPTSLTTGTFTSTGIDDNATSTAITIDSSQNVGIGTASPAALLDIKDASSPTLRLTGDGANTANKPYGSLEFYNLDSSGGGPQVGAKIEVESSPTGTGAGGQLAFYGGTGAATEYMRIDASGNVGIGTSSPLNLLDVVETDTTAESGTVATFRTTSGGYLYFQASDKSIANPTWSIGTATSEELAFGANNGERMRIDSSGNLLVGKTSDDITVAGCQLNATGAVLGTRASGSAMSLNRTGTDGTIADFRKNGTVIGVIKSNGTDNLVIEGTASGHCGLQFASQFVYPRLNEADADGTVTLGNAVARFDDIYATNGTIQTSDVNEKQDIEALSEAETRVAVAAKGLLRKFRWKSAVEEKGDDARIHFGIIAQDLQAAFEAEGLDAGRYGMFIHSTWTDEETGEERSRMGVRYSELLAFIIAAI